MNRANTSSGKPNEMPKEPTGEARKLSRESRPQGWRIGEQRAQKAKPTRFKV
jgi:hypothetical protein